MASIEKVPPMSEASFRRHYSRIWTIVGAGCMITGLFLNLRLRSPRHPWLTIVIGLCLYLFTLLLCDVALVAVWRRPLATPPVLFFSVPIGAAGLAVVLVMRWIGPNYLSVSYRSLGGLTLSIGLLYFASLIWAIAVGIRRKKLGHFYIEDRR